MKFDKYKKNSERPREHVLYIIAKWAMTVIFLWSGFFWSGVSVINFYCYSPEYSHRATGFLVGSVLLLIALVLCWAKKYIIQLPFTIGGLIPFLMTANEMILEAAAHPDIIYKRPTHELRYLPVIVFALIALVFFTIKVMNIYINRKRKQEEFNNRPSKSILDD